MFLNILEQYNISNFNFEIKKIKYKSFNLILQYASTLFFLQSPVCTVEKIIYENEEEKTNPKQLLVSFPIGDNFAHFKFFGSLNNFIYEYIKKFMVRNKIMESKDVSSKYNSGCYELSKADSDLTNYMIELKLDKSTKYYNKNKETIRFSIKENDSIVFLFYTKGVFLDRFAINYRWTAKQVLKLI